MGSLAMMKDLEVRIHDSFLVFPSQETKKRSFFLSNIDKALNFNVDTVHFFPACEAFPFEGVVERVKAALADVLVPYDFLAGRLNSNAQTGRLEIDCNASGVGFAVASSEYALDHIGDLVYPNPAFAKLVTTSLAFLQQNDQPLFILQLTSFKCGGFAMGISNNHATFDGLSFKTFLQNLGAVAAGKPLAVPPCNERRLLAARSPPLVSFPHPELLTLPAGHAPPASVFEASPQHLDFNVFHLSPHDIKSLKSRASKGDVISSFNAVAGLVWRCKALSGGPEPDRESRMLYAVDIRGRVDPPLPEGYSGNAVLSAYATASLRELEEGPEWRVVERVREGACRVTGDYARSVIDWGEECVGFPNGEFLVSSWWRLGFEEVDYPWGRPAYSCPVVYHRKDIILLFPDIGRNNGVNVLVALPRQEMDKFGSLFYRFLRNN